MLPLVVALPLALPQLGAEEFDPRSYASRSGRYELHVTPSDPQGAGAGAYELRLDGRRQWSGERELTLRDVVLGDDGAAAGVAYTEGLHHHSGGELVLAFLTAGGELVRLDALPRENSRFVDAANTPVANGVFLHADEGVVVFRIADPDLNRQSEGWRRYHFPGGRALPALEPKAFQPDAERLLGMFAAEPVHGTPFVLVHWLLRDGEELGARFALLDLEAAAAWSLDLPDDYAHGTAFEVHRDGALLPTDAPATFALRHAGDGLRVDYAVERDAGGAWQVRELARAAWNDPRRTLPQPEPIPTLALTRVGTLALDGGDAELSQDGRAGTVAAVALGPEDEVHAVSLQNGVVHVLAPSGELSRRCIPDPGDVPDAGCPHAALTVGPDGSVLVDYAGDGARHVRFSAAGDREGADHASVDGRAWHALPDGGLLVLGARSAWVLPGGAYPEEGAQPTVLERGRDGTWLRNLHDASVAPDGSFVLVDLPAPGADARTQRVKLHVYAARGKPHASFPIPGHEAGLVYPRIAWDGRRIAVVVQGRLLLLDPVGLALAQAALEDASSADRARPLFPRSAEELWIFDGVSAIHRYAPAE